MPEPVMTPTEDPLILIDSHNLTLLREYGRGAAYYSPEVFQALQREVRFVPLEKLPRLDFETGRKVGLGLTECPLCGGTTAGSDWREVPVRHEGVSTGYRLKILQPCPCVRYQRFWERWVSQVPLKYQGVVLGELRPTSASVSPIAFQKRVLTRIQERPYDSYLLCGDSGAGKTTYLIGLFGRALRDWAQWATDTKVTTEGAWRMETHTLLAQHTDWNRQASVAVVNSETGGVSLADAPSPTVTVAKIRAAAAKGFRPRLFLDEVDKVAFSQAKQAILFDLLDAVYAANGQLVVSSNMSHEEFASLLGDRYGTALTRRILDAVGTDREGKITRGAIVDLFSNTLLEDGVAQPQVEPPTVARKATQTSPQATQQPSEVPQGSQEPAEESVEMLSARGRAEHFNVGPSGGKKLFQPAKPYKA